MSPSEKNLLITFGLIAGGIFSFAGAQAYAHFNTPQVSVIYEDRNGDGVPDKVTRNRAVRTRPAYKGVQAHTSIDEIVEYGFETKGPDGGKETIYLTLEEFKSYGR